MRSGQATFGQVCLMLFMLIAGSMSAASAAAGDPDDAALVSHQRSETTGFGQVRMGEETFGNAGWYGFAQGAEDGYYICHATGNPDVFVAMSPNSAGVVNGHLGHQGGRDIIPPIEHRGQWYSQNWDGAPESQAIHAAGCVEPPPPSDPPPSSLPLPLLCGISATGSAVCYDANQELVDGTCEWLDGSYECTFNGTVLSCEHHQDPFVPVYICGGSGGGGGSGDPVLPLNCTVTSDGTWACEDAEGTQFSATCSLVTVFEFGTIVLKFRCTVVGGATYSCADATGSPLATTCTELA